MAGNTVRLHRVLRAPPARVYRAFLSPDAMANAAQPSKIVSKLMGAFFDGRCVSVAA